jgi:hypothetical protein
MTHKEKEIPKHVTKLREMAKDLVAVGWEKITVEYYGGGDEITDYTINLHHEDGSVETVEDVAPALLPENVDKVKLIDALFELPPEGFENNDGGQGEITIDCASGAITVSHDTFYTESKNDTWSY